MLPKYPTKQEIKKIILQKPSVLKKVMEETVKKKMEYKKQTKVPPSKLLEVVH